MIKNYMKFMFSGVMLALFLFPSTTALAKEKAHPISAPPKDLAWMNGQEVLALFEGGFWCANPIGDTCTFTSTTLAIGENEVIYQVSGFWDEATIINLDYVAEIAPDGILCESGKINLDSLTATDREGTPLSKARMNNLLDSLSSNLENSSDEKICFGYVVLDAEHPYSITQYEVDIEFNILSVVSFDVSYAADAAEQFKLRWE